MYKIIQNINLKNKKVILRVAYDVPLKKNGNGLVITDNSRIKISIPTIKYLLKQNCKIILVSYLGRPNGKVIENLRLKPIAKELVRQLANKKEKIIYLKDCIGKEVEKKIENMQSNEIILLENTRFYPEEEENDLKFAKKLANLGEVFINDAFAQSHRMYASTVGITNFLPSAMGLNFEKEIKILDKIKTNFKKPLVIVIGGVKINTKIEVIKNFLKQADWILIGGTLSQNSKPAVAFDAIKSILFAGLTSDGFDINEESIKKFTDIIKTAGTIVWNGPMGKYEEEKYEIGTRKIVEAIAENQGFSVVGGGDTIAALTKFNLIDKMDYVSTGGGAMLEFLAQGTLPGIEALK